MILEVIVDQRSEVEAEQLTARNLELDNFNTVVVGVRRAGKSSLLFALIQKLLAAGKSWSDILYLNFEDERLQELTASDLNLVLEAFATLSGKKPILFFDEIQNVDGWEKFVRRTADFKYLTYITGSNARMLGKEVASSLGGRFMIETLFPYDFGEFLRAKGVQHLPRSAMTTLQKGENTRLLREFLTFGGFPESLRVSRKKNYLSGIYEKLYLGDIALRNRLRNPQQLRLLLKKAAESVNQPISLRRLANEVSASGTSFTHVSAAEYLRCCEEAFLLFSIANYQGSFAEREGKKKYYFIDQGLLSILRLDARSAQFENAVASMLVRTYGLDGQVFFYRNGVEVDFYVPQTGLALQACLDPSDEATLARECRALAKLAAAPNTPCERLVVVTESESRTVEFEGRQISLTPFSDWMLQLQSESSEA